MATYRCLLADGSERLIEAPSVPAALAGAGQPVSRIADVSARRLEPRVTEQELATFYRQIGSMLQSGLPLAEGLQVLARDTPNRDLKQVSQTLHSTLAAGLPLADGLAQFPSLFPPLHLALARAGEHGGLLPVTLSQMADYMERLGRLGRRFSSALVYPAVVGSIVVLLLSSYWGAGIAGNMLTVFKDLGIASSLPGLTQLILSVSRVAIPLIITTAVTLFIIVLILRAYYRTRRGRYRLDRAKLGLPFIGQVAYAGSLGRFSRTLALLLGSHVEIETALPLAGEASGNAVLARAVRSAIGDVIDGTPLAPALSATGMFPASLAEHIAAGENSGTMLLTLDNVADFYDAQADHYARAFAAVIEPLLIVVLGLAVGLSIVGLMLPLVSAISGLSGGDM